VTTTPTNVAALVANVARYDLFGDVHGVTIARDDRGGYVDLEDYVALANTLADLQADLYAVRAERDADKARLDWLDTQRWEAGDRDGNNPPDYCQWDVQGQTWDVRSAIDAARAASEGTTP
jgi:hypothetical protein